ncbi:MAG: N-acetylmannosamine-6-phosphate 2-epimerase [Bacilli bacterium]
MLNKIKNGLIVSCQALPDEPLHSSFIMGRMAKAAIEGGAVGIRANTFEDINEIKKFVDAPVIGIVKRNYGSHPVFITPTMKEVDELVMAGADIIATDATTRIRPDGLMLADFVKAVREKYPNQRLFADVSTYAEAVQASELGFDIIAPTLVGYTEQSKGMQIAANDFALLKQIIASVEKPVIAEGNFDTPEKARRAIELGCHSVVVGGAITRPQLITKKFVEAI